jgi:hypothetical protein
MPGAADDSCGAGGGVCLDCAGGGTACEPTQKRCVPAGCTPSCDGKCAGADDGCGGKCAAGNCAGCCRGGVCLDGATDESCGKDGAECSDCSAQQGKCSAGSCSNCTPNCAGKCAGASDDCGGACATSGCAGCCAGGVCQGGTAQNACGKGGGACADCGTQPCEAGACASCIASCTGKCKGDTDNCGGTCAANDCSGCCDVNTAKCNPGTTKLLCGQNGERCWVCPDDFEGYSWKCVSQTCVKDQPSPTFCQGKTGGTVACTSGTLSGKCWDDACCTGCWNSKTSACVAYASSYADKTCGKGGATCVDCSAATPSPKQCSSSSRTCVPYIVEASIGGTQRNFTDIQLASYYLTPTGSPPAVIILGTKNNVDNVTISFYGKTVGTYTCGGGKASLRYSDLVANERYAAEPAEPGTTCTVTVTQVGAVGQRIKGTFSGVMWPITATGYATLSVDGGSFDVIRGSDVP